MSPVLGGHRRDSLFVQSNEHSDTDDGPRPKRLKSEAMSGDVLDESDEDESYEEPTQEEEDHVPAYNVLQEDLPRLAAYHENFPKAQVEIVKACNIIIDTNAELQATGYHNEEMATVCGPLGLGAINPPSKMFPSVRPVAVYGPAGSGKSSAMNAIMSQKKVAFEHDGEDRGTYVVHEYRSQAPGQTSQYQVVVPYFLDTDIHREIINRVRDIQAYFHDPEEDSQADEDGAEEKALQERYDTAVTIIHDLLCDKKSFTTKQSTAVYFEQHARRKKDDLVQEVLGPVLDFKRSRGLKDNIETRSPQSTSELHDDCKQIARPQKAFGKDGKLPSPWGIIRKIIVHQDDRLLNSGVVLADTPGINDSNLAVVENTKRYLKDSAGTILIFSSYKRIDQNSPLDQMLRFCIGHGKMNSTRLVITHIDEMKFGEEDWMRMDDQERNLYTQAESKLLKMTKQYDKAAKDKRKAGENLDKYRDADLKLSRLELEKAETAAALMQMRIQSRCRCMRESLEGRIKNIEKGRNAPDLPISFISNTQYQKHVDGYKPTEPPILDVEATGIPELRRCLFAVPARGKLPILKNIHGNRLPGLLGGIFGILTKSKLERKNEVLKLLTDNLGKHEWPVKDLMNTIRSAFKDLIADVFMQKQPEWKKTADKLVVKWSDPTQMNATTFKGICCRGGEWSGHRKLKDVNLNLDFIEIMSDSLMEAFNLLDKEIDGVEKDFSFNIQEVFFDIDRSIRSSPAALGQDLEAFFDFIATVGGYIADRMQAKFENLKEAIGNIRHAATVDSDHAYIRKAMESVYEKCILTNGTSLPPIAPQGSTTTAPRTRRKKPSVHGNRMTLVHNKVHGNNDNRSLFDSVADSATNDLNKKLNEWSQGCKEIVKAGFDEVMRDFHSRYKSDEGKKEENTEAVAKLQAAAIEAREILDGPMKTYLEECEEYEAGRAGSEARSWAG